MAGLKGVHSGQITLIPSLREVKKTLPAFKVGEEVVAKVVQKIKGSQYMIQIKGSDMIAESRLPLAKGDQIHLIIKRVTPDVILAPAPRGETPWADPHIF